MIPHTLINLGEPRPGFQHLADLIQGAGVAVRSYRNGDLDGHDLVTDVPFTLLMENYRNIVPLTQVSATPLPGDPWFLFRYHHVQLYQEAVSALPEIPEILPGITDLDIVNLIVGIYEYPGSAPVLWDHLDSGADDDGVYWGIKYLAGADVLIFRGSSDLEDWMRDLNCVARPFGDSKLGPVHPGFRLGMGDVVEEAKVVLRPGMPLIIGGHSLGAGRAAIAAGLFCAG